MKNAHERFLAGPWTAEPDAEGEPDFYSVWYDEQGTGAEVAGRIGDAEAARLIAAAPELLAALEELLGWQSTAPQAVINEARAAIDKARGQS